MNRDDTDTLLGLLDRLDLAHGDLEERVDEAVTTAQTVLRVDGTGLLLATSAGEFAVVGASNPAAAALEHAQRDLGDGPGPDATRRGVVVAVPDLQRDPRWPSLAERMDPQVHAVLAAPVWFDGRTAGNLNALCFAPRAWSREDAHTLTAYAGVITACLRISLAAGHEEPLVAELRTTLGA